MKTGTELVLYVIEKRGPAEKDTGGDEYSNTGCVFAHKVTREQHFKIELSAL